MPDQTPSRALRRFTLGSGPLKRTSDRLEYLSRLLLTGMLLAGVAVALTVATAVSTNLRSDVAAQTAERLRVTARLEEDVRTPADASGTALVLGPATAVWSSPSGKQHTGVVAARIGLEAGSTVSIWIDRDGNRTTRPLSSGDVVGQAAGFAVLTYFGIAMLAWGAQDTFRRMLDRGRSRRWAAEWAAVGPVWTGRVP